MKLILVQGSHSTRLMSSGPDQKHNGKITNVICIFVFVLSLFPGKLGTKFLIRLSPSESAGIVLIVLTAKSCSMFKHFVF